MKRFFTPARIIGLILLLAGLWYFRTWFHTPVMFFYTRPEVIEGILVAWLVSRFGLGRWPFLTRQRRLELEVGTTQAGQPKTTTYRYRLLPLLAGLAFILIPLLFLLLGSWGRATYLAQTLPYEKIERLYDSSTRVRLMPFEVAYRYAKDSLQLSQYRLGTGNMVLRDGKLSWVFPLRPDGLVITFTRQNKGILVVDATTQEKNSEMIQRDMRVGEGMQITDNLWWNLFRKRYFVTTEDPYYIDKDGEIYTIVPAVRYEFRLYWGIVHTVPRFAGLFLVDTQGTVAFLSPEEARENPITAGNRIFPELLAREYVNAYQFKLGVLNKLFIHEDQIQIQDVTSPIQINRQPFLIMTEKGPMWLVATEPYGESHGIFKIFIVDAVTGRLMLYELPEQGILTGPVRAADYVRRANPIVDWSRFELVEPLPFIRDGHLFWKFAVIPGDAAGIAYQAFVNSESNEVVEAQTDQDVAAFLAGRTPEAFPATGTTGDIGEIIRQIQEKLKEIEDLIRQLQSLETE